MKPSLSMRLSAAAFKLNNWSHVAQRARDLSEASGFLKLFAIPGLVASLMKATVGAENIYLRLRRLGFESSSWLKLLSAWLVENVGKEDPKITQPIVLDYGPESPCTAILYSGIGLVHLDYGEHQAFYATSSGETEKWIQGVLSRKGGGIFRITPLPLEKRDGPQERTWSLDHTRWKKPEAWVEGPWAPTPKEVSEAMFPEDGDWRPVLLWGPSGVGKTETAIKACRLKQGDNSCVLVVHGSVFAQFGKGLSGKDAASLMRVLGASALIVDDIPPQATVDLLEEVEALHRQNIAVALTLMTSGVPPTLTGLRPGRVDKFLEFHPPDASGRQDLLQKYCPRISWEKLSQDPQMSGMTPAYLRELARRVTRGENPEAALGSLAQQKQIAS